jgi:predicted nuclease with TOPRIM domain
MSNLIQLQPCGCHEGRDCTMVRQCYVEEMVRVQRVTDEAEIEALRARVAELDSSLNAAGSRVSALESENAVLRWRISDLEQNIENLRGQVNAWEVTP